MIEILDMNDANIFGLRLDGKLELGDIRRVLDELDERMKNRQRIRLYYEIEDMNFGDISLKMIEEEFRWLFRHPGFIPQMEKAVLVTDIGWLRNAFAVEAALIPTLTGKSFSLDEKTDALAWLRKDHRAEGQLDIVFPELFRFGTVKGLAGFGLGLLAADYLSRTERKKVGLVALAGGFVLGVPLAIKFLNNNRKFLGLISPGSRTAGIRRRGEL